jgi:hypothetical protein
LKDLLLASHSSFLHYTTSVRKLRMALASFITQQNSNSNDDNLKKRILITEVQPCLFQSQLEKIKEQKEIRATPYLAHITLSLPR